MVVTPVWQAASAGSGANAGHANQFLGLHASSVLLAGATLRSSQTTGRSPAAYTDSYTNLISQTIVTTNTQTNIGSIGLQLNAVGGSPTLSLIPSITVGLYADLLGGPTGTALAMTSITGTYVYNSSFWVQIPLSASGLTPSTTYHIVTSMSGNSSHYYAWQRSNQTSGAATSPDGTTWTNQSYGMMYQVYDANGTGQVQFVYDDGGARWLLFSYNSNNTLASVIEHVAAQNGSYIQNTRSFVYSNNVMTSLV